ncbi:hypothetical protein Dda_3519 [Drechslerella dactyloides]|uniref:Uncharacterized protein n=1 Tax=Drechslerella dactyloides TaxID=74499 RepID=A0AAD6NL84_DREDA|nr:hypothetical protein Dda_3519 [Drechslerella dactyloides]
MFKLYNTSIVENLTGNAYTQHKTLDVLTLFHSPRSEASNRVLSALKAANTAAEESAAAPAAAPAASNGSNGKKEVFELDVVEGPMTPTQLRSILDYVGDAKVGDIVDGAKGVTDAMKILEGAKDANKLKRPISSSKLDGLEFPERSYRR